MKQYTDPSIKGVPDWEKIGLVSFNDSTTASITIDSEYSQLMLLPENKIDTTAYVKCRINGIATSSYDYISTDGSVTTGADEWRGFMALGYGQAPSYLTPGTYAIAADTPGYGKSDSPNVLSGHLTGASTINEIQLTNNTAISESIQVFGWSP